MPGEAAHARRCSAVPGAGEDESARRSPAAFPRASDASSLVVAVNENADLHERAMRTHEAAVERHETAAEHWTKLGDEERAGFERRAARLERELADLERDMARVARERPISRRMRDELL